MPRQEDNPLPTEFQVPFISGRVWLSVLCSNLSIKTQASLPLALILAWKELPRHGWARCVCLNPENTDSSCSLPEINLPSTPQNTRRQRRWRSGFGEAMWKLYLQ